MLVKLRGARFLPYVGQVFGSSFELDWGIGTAAPHGLSPDALSHAQPAPPFSLAWDFHLERRFSRRDPRGPAAEL